MPTAPPRHNARQTKVNRATTQAEYDKTKRTNAAFYNSSQWRKLRRWFVSSNPLCIECRAKGRVVAVDVVDHIIELKDGGAALDVANLQALCHSHHNKKSAEQRELRTK